MDFAQQSTAAHSSRPQINVQHLSKDYRVHHRLPGLSNSIRAIFRRQYEVIHAVQNVSFTIEAGEIIGFLGANGAGKTTVLKMLAGLLHPGAGDISVMGFTPHKRDPEYLRQFTFVMGNRNQLLWDLPASETFLVNQAIYRVPDKEFRETLDELITVLELTPLLTKQVRKLSLGERMKCEIAAALIHRPKVLFLDEPTIGLDVTTQAAIRDFIRIYNKKYNATVLLTSHYMRDVTALASRVMIIDHGSIMYDGDLYSLVERTAPYKLLQLTLQRPIAVEDLLLLGEIESIAGLHVTLRVAREQIKEIATSVLTTIPITDISIEEPPIEDVIRKIFHRGDVYA